MQVYVAGALSLIGGGSMLAMVWGAMMYRYKLLRELVRLRSLANYHLEQVDPPRHFLDPAVVYQHRLEIVKHELLDLARDRTTALRMISAKPELYHLLAEAVVYHWETYCRYGYCPELADDVMDESTEVVQFVHELQLSVSPSTSRNQALQPC